MLSMNKLLTPSMRFSNIVGNASAKEHLNHLLDSGKVAHTLLFTGPSGIGKSLFATECGLSLMQVTRSDHPDLHHYKPQGKSAMHTVESMHELQETLAHSPFEARCKVAIIHSAERMLPSSSNALLKTLEEPTHNSFIILLSDDPDTLLPTITSRCQKVLFSAIDETTLASLLLDYPEEQRRRYARLSQGSYGRMRLLTSSRWKTLLPELIALLQAQDALYLFKTLQRWEEEFAKLAEDPNCSWLEELNLLFSLIILWHRDCALLAQGGSKELLFFPQDQCVARSFPLHTILTLVEECQKAVQHNVKLRVALHHLFTHA